MSWRRLTAAESPAGLAGARARAKGRGAPPGLGRLLPQETSGRVSELSRHCARPGLTLYVGGALLCRTPGFWGGGARALEAWGDPPEAFSGHEYTGMILPLSPPDSGQAVCVWGQWSHVGWVRGRDIFWWMGREQFQVWLPLEAQSSEETLPRPGEAPAPSQLDCKLLQWCLGFMTPGDPLL